MSKLAIIEALGETGLQLPELLHRGLAANDRLKYYLTLLQSAAGHARMPNRPASPLREEREASGVDDATLDRVVHAAREVEPGIVSVPDAARLLALIFEDLAEMIRPLNAAADVCGGEREQAFLQRLERLQADAPRADTDRLALGAIDAMTSAGDATRDTVHQLVMDLHRELNLLQASIATETIDGASTYGVTDGDRGLVRAFMAGVNETAALKFDHPGLATTATRLCDRLSIQNDLGTTAAHVVVIHVRGLEVTLVYTDVHRKRAAFVRQMLRSFAVTWHAGSAPSDAGYEMSVGQFTADTEEALARYLTFLGSRLVFVIDWNRARKRLARIVSKPAALDVLHWAAEHGVGHRAFLQLGGLRLIETALERVAPASHAVRLDTLIGRDAAHDFLTAVLALSTAALRAGRPARLVEDEVEAELRKYVHSTRHSVLDAAAEHAMLMSSLIERLRRAVLHGPRQEPQDAAHTAELAKQWETRADEIVRRWTRILDHAEDRSLRPLLTAADDAADALEEAAYLLTLVRRGDDVDRLATLGTLADLVGDEVREYIRCLEFAKGASSGGRDVERCLLAVSRVGDLEHASDIAERAARAHLLGAAADFRDLYVLTEIAKALETAADAICRCCVIVRDVALAPEGAAA